MRKTIYFWLVGGISLFVLVSMAAAQDEQWLQYRSAREARRIVGDMGMNGLELTTEKPEGVELPEFNVKSPLFTKWSSPFVKDAYLWVSLDRSHKRGLYDLLYIDSDGDGHLKDEPVTKAHQVGQYESMFGPAKVIFEGEDGPITYHLNFVFYGHRGQNRLYVSPGGWYEGTIVVEGKKKHCVLIDHNVNGTFDDKSINANECDRIRVGKKDDRDTRFVGNYIEIDDKLYRPEIARDGAYVKLTRPEDVVFGNVRLPESITEFAAGGENGLLYVRAEKGLGRLPLGTYRIHHWTIDHKGKKNKRWRLEGRRFGENGNFEVAEGKEVALRIGEPIASSLEVVKRGSSYLFRQELKGQLDEQVSLTVNEDRPRPPRLHIASADGSYNKSLTFEYG